MEDAETVEFGGIQVPKEFKARFDELTSQVKTLKVSLYEAQTEAKEAKLAVEQAGKGPNPELESARTRIAELEAGIAKAAHDSVLGADGMSEADAEFYDYVQYQYGKVQVEEGKEKPAFGDWYAEAKASNRVIQAAIREKQASSQTESGVGKSEEKKAAPKVAPKTLPARNPTNGSEGAFDAKDIGTMDPKTFAKNREALRKQMFGS